MHLLLDRLESPIGAILLVSDGQRLCALDFAEFEPRLRASLRARFGPFHLRPTDDPNGFSSRLCAYFGGALEALDEIPVRLAGTPFQQRVWAALRQIPAGSTRSYRALAELLGQPAASRAVGRANALNPVSIVVPCHRLVGADGSLAGYAAGLERKRWLLAHEGALPAAPPDGALEPRS